MDEIPDYDSSEDLPELFKKVPFHREKLSKNDIVWAEFRNLHWPALVRHVDKKKKKVSVWYLDSPQKSFKLSFSKIHDFNDPEFRLKVRQAADASPSGALHKEIHRATLIFIGARSKGFNVSPAECFDRSKLYFVFLNLTGANTVDSSNATSQTESPWCDENDISVGSSDTESLSESGTDDDSLKKYYSEITNEPPTPEEKKQIDAIYSYIKEGHMDKYLLGVINGKISSEKHELFVEAMKTKNKKPLWVSTPNVNFKDDEKFKELSYYLKDLFEKNIVGGKCEMTEYIVSVWLPEALDKAASLIEAEPSKFPAKQNFQILPCTSSERYSFSSLFDNDANLDCVISKTPPSTLDVKSKVSSKISKKNLITTKTPRKRCSKKSTKRKIQKITKSRRKKN